MRFLVVASLVVAALASGCSCNVVAAEDDAGVGGGAAAGGSSGSSGGVASGGGVAGGASTAGGQSAGGAAGGATAGGAAGAMGGGNVAGGAMAGGPVAGGMTAGGPTAGGMTAGGMTAGGAAQLDVYVCSTCPGASATNPGTAQRPVDTIARGLALAQMANLPRVIVATRGGGVTATYSEDITMVDGRTLDGRWVVTGNAGNLTWARSGNRTLLRNTQATGLKFPAGVGGTTIVDGFSIEKAAPGLGAGRVAGVTITSSSPLLRDFDVDFPAVAIGTATEAIGIDVVGTTTAPASPTLQGVGATTVSAGPASTTSIGLAVVSSRVTVTAVDFTAGNAMTMSAAVALSAGAGSTFTRGVLAAGSATTCFGFVSSGEASGVRVENVTATGCGRVANVVNAPRLGVGVLFDNCPPLAPGGTSPIVRNVVATGGIVGGAGSSAVGGAALDGCAVRFEATAGGTSTFTGATQAPALGMGPETTVGLACSNAGVRNMNGFDARCSVSGVTAIGGTVSATNAVGLACDGSCANQPVSCTGSCAEVVGNTFSAGSGATMSHVLLRHSSPALRQNQLGVGALTCGTNATVAGLALTGSAASVVNNLIIAGSCQTSIGVAHTLTQRSDGAPQPTFHSNTIISTTANGGGTPTVTSVGVQLAASPVSSAVFVAGTWRNNVIVAGASNGTGAVSYAFRELSANVDPTAMTNNLFHTNGATTYYLDEGSSVLQTAAAINALTGASANLVGSPQFVNAGNGNFSLSNGSPARGAGSPMGAPTVDLTNAPRPQPANTNPDLGCYEVN